MYQPGSPGSEDSTRARRSTSNVADLPSWQVSAGSWRGPQCFPHRPPQRNGRMFSQQKVGSPQSQQSKRPRQKLNALYDPQKSHSV